MFKAEKSIFEFITEDINGIKPVSMLSYCSFKKWHIQINIEGTKLSGLASSVSPHVSCSGVETHPSQSKEYLHFSS